MAVMGKKTGWSVFGVCFHYMQGPCSDEPRPGRARTAPVCGSVLSTMISDSSFCKIQHSPGSLCIYLFTLFLFFFHFSLLIACVALSRKNCMQFICAYSSICFIYWVYRDGPDSWINSNSKLLLYLHTVCLFFFLTCIIWHTSGGVLIVLLWCLRVLVMNLKPYCTEHGFSHGTLGGIEWIVEWECVDGFVLALNYKQEPTAFGGCHYKIFLHYQCQEDNFCSPL